MHTSVQPLTTCMYINGKKKNRNNDINVEHAPSVIRQLLHLCYLMQQVSSSATAVPVIYMVPIILPIYIIYKYIIYTDHAITAYTIILYSCIRVMYTFLIAAVICCVPLSLFIYVSSSSQQLVYIYANMFTIVI